MALPRQLKFVLNQACSQIAGSIASRSSQRNGERQERCHPAVAVSQASAVSHVAVNNAATAMPSHSSASAANAAASSGGSRPDKGSSAK